MLGIRRDEQMQPGFLTFKISHRGLVLLKGRLFLGQGGPKKLKTTRWDFAMTVTQGWLE